MSDFKLVKIIDPTAIVVGGLVPRGVYNSATVYNVGDSVSYNNFSYVAYVTGTSFLPTDTTHWQLLAAQGATGATGATGPAGPSGAGGDKNYIQVFNTVASVAVAHNLGKYPAIEVLDSALSLCEGTVVHSDINNLTITFSASFSGTVTCN